MNITLTITTDSAAELANIAAALAGNAPAAAPAPAATVTRGKSPKADAHAVQAAVSAPAADPAPVQTTATSLSEPAAPVEVTDADLMAAANAAVMKVGPGAQAKVKAFIAEKFQQEDGSPAGLKTVKAAQKAELLASLQAIGQGGTVL